MRVTLMKDLFLQVEGEAPAEEGELAVVLHVHPLKPHTFTPAWGGVAWWLMAECRRRAAGGKVRREGEY